MFTKFIHKTYRNQNFICIYKFYNDFFLSLIILQNAWWCQSPKSEGFFSQTANSTRYAQKITEIF